MDTEDLSHLPFEINDINIAKTEDGNFKIIFGTKTDIEGFYKGFAEVEVDRAILERFARRAQEPLGEDQ